MAAMSKQSGERIKGTGFILIAIGTLGLIFNDFVFQGSSAVTISFATVDFLGLVCLITGGLIAKDEVKA